MLRLTGALIAAVLATVPASAQREPEYVFITDPRVLVGEYHFEEKGFTIDVSLNANGTALYLVHIGSEGSGIRAEGIWEVRGDKIHIRNQPGAVRLDPAGVPTRDPSVALRVVATLPDGSPAEGLGVTWPGATGMFYMSDGRHETRKEEGPVVGEVTVERSSDGKTLATLPKTADGPNSFRFTYHPSDVEPFEYKAAALDPRADVLEVEVGSASAMLRRVR